MNSENNRKHIEQGARARLLEAGVKLFSEKGYANTSVREIVELASVSKPILYYYFKSKEEILLEYIILYTQYYDLADFWRSVSFIILRQISPGQYINYSWHPKSSLFI